MTEYEYTMGRNLDLKVEADKTLNTPPMECGLFLKGLFFSFDLLYGKARTLPKFVVLELLARYPYWAWESGGYHMLTRLYTKITGSTDTQRKLALHFIDLGRESQDNEQWHLMLLEDILQQKGIKMGLVMGKIIPKIMAITYFCVSHLVYLISPNLSFSINAAFEDHAEHEYMMMAKENPEWDEEELNSKYFEYYPKQKTLGDLIRRIGLDERDHKFASLEVIERYKNER